MAQNSHAAVIRITETWHSVADHEIIVPNNTSEWIETDLAFNQRNAVSDNQLELLWIELLLPYTRSFLISTCYRHDILENICTQKDRVLAL